MQRYPVNLNVEGRRCVVVGGGDVGTRKALRLAGCGARVTVISPGVAEALRPSIDGGAVRWVRRGYRSSDLAPAGGPDRSGGIFLVISTTDDPAVNAQVRDDARRFGILCNIADRFEDCDFTLPAVVARGDLTVAVSTSGKSPALARRLRKDLEVQLGEEYAMGLKLMGAVRKKLLGEGHDPEAHKRRFRALIDGGLISLIREGRFDEVDRLLAETMGEGYTFESLMKAT
jgi:precorrin-2 dehydrogenase/sirohydrochlorin ferrochelatase